MAYTGTSKVDLGYPRGCYGPGTATSCRTPGVASLLEVNSGLRSFQWLVSSFTVLFHAGAVRHYDQTGPAEAIYDHHNYGDIPGLSPGIFPLPYGPSKNS